MSLIQTCYYKKNNKKQQLFNV